MASALTVPVPLRRAPLGGLLSVANVIDTDDPHILQGVQYVPEGCEFPLLTPGSCWATVNPPDVPDPEDPEGPDISATEKTFDGIPPAPTPTSFVLHAAVECYTGPDNDFLQRADRILSLGESFAIEQVLFSILNVPAAIGPETGLPAAIARVEQWLGANYPGLGLLHLDRRQASLAGSNWSIQRSGSTLATVQGLPVVNGSGYGTDTGAVRTPSTIFGSGQVNIWRGPTSRNQTINPAFNTELALVERAYAFTIDCNAIVKVTVA